MKVSELIEFLQKQPQDLLVAYRCFSEQCLMETNEIEIKKLCEARPDGWIQNGRPDKEAHEYLVFPGN